MEGKEIVYIIISLLGWIFGITQFLLKRRYQRKDKRVDRKYEAYSAYMKKSDELMKNVRTDPNMIFGIWSDFLKIALTGDEVSVNNALIQFNEKLINFAKRTSEPLLILKQELNSLLLICSDELALKIEELSQLTTDFNTEMQKSLSLISPNDSNSIVRQFENLGHNKRWLRFETLNKEIIKLMRQEIEYQ